MDKFEKEYFDELKNLAPKYKNQIHEIAKNRIKMFSAAVARQLITEKKQFDLIIGPGNSGLVMTKLASFVYEELSINKPPELNLPVQRVIEENDVTGVFKLSNDYLEKLKGFGHVSNILFVDDEIMRATTARECFEALIKMNPNIKHLNVTIIAENHFFEWHYEILNVSVKFYAYARLIQGLNGIIGYFISDDLYNEAIEFIEDINDYNDLMALIVGGALKRVRNNESYYDFEVEKVLEEKIKDYPKRKEVLIEELKSLVKQGVEEYK